jgi:hypothetical protein
MIVKTIKELSAVMDKLYSRARELLQYGAIIIEIDSYKPNRSKDQNDYYYRLCGEISEFLMSAGLRGYTKKKVHDINKEQFNIDSTKDLSKEDFCDYITKVTEFWQEATKNFWQPSENPRVFLKRRGY